MKCTHIKEAFYGNNVCLSFKEQCQCFSYYFLCRTVQLRMTYDLHTYIYVHVFRKRMTTRTMSSAIHNVPATRILWYFSLLLLHFLIFSFFLWWKECARVGEGVDMLPCRVVVSFCFYYKSVTTLCSNILFDKGYNKNDYMLIRKHFLFSLPVIRNISNLQKYSLFLFFVLNIAKKDFIFLWRRNGRRH